VVNITDIEFLLVQQSKVRKPEFGCRNVYIFDAFEVTLIPLQPIIYPTLHNIYTGINLSFKKEKEFIIDRVPVEIIRLVASVCVRMCVRFFVCGRSPV